MTRKDFISTLGLGAAFVLTSTCLSSCGKNSASPVDFTVDLQSSANSALLNNGGYIVTNSVVVAKTTTGQYVAATVICSHEQKHEVILKNDEWFCTAHDARFGLTGSGLNSNGNKGLTVYSVEKKDANTLRVFS